MNQRAIIHIIFAVLGIPVLITIGIWSATDPLYAGVAAIIVIGIVVLSQLGKKVWLLIPLFAVFSGAVNMLPGHFAPRDLAVGVAAAILPPIWVMKRFPIRFRLGSIEVALLALFAFVGQAYFRNPVGLSIFGSGVIGGRPYFELVVSVVAFLILSVQIVDFKSIRLMIFANFAGSVALPIYNTVLGLFPSLAIYGASIYQSGTTSRAISEHLLGSDPNQGGGRRAYLARFSRPIMNLILAFKSPLQLIVPKNFGYLLLAAFAGVCVLLGGFRSGVAGYGMLVIVAAILHRKPIQLVVMGLIGGPVIAVLLVLQGAVIELPSPAQRALSFLPADWNDDAVENAQDSSEWRFEMWEVALSSDRYIRNKWFGDGFGFTARELSYQMELMATGMAPADMQDSVANNFRSQAADRISPEIDVSRIRLGRVLINHARRLAIDITVTNQPMSRFQAPLLLDQLDRQIIQQLLMTGCASKLAKIARSFHDTSAKVSIPDPIYDHTSGERILGRRDPVS